MTGTLAGRRVVITRERRGELGRLLDERGAVVLHVPLIAVVDADDGGVGLRTELARLDRYDWLIVTSPAGAERVGAAVAAHPEVRLAAVGTATARALAALAGRPVDVVPTRQVAESLVAALGDAARPASRMLIAQADRARDVLSVELRDAGHHVTAVVAYRTVDVRPDLDALDDAVLTADAAVFASGSAVESWVRAFGTGCPPVTVAIGPATADAAQRSGLKITAVAADHSLDGLVTELERALAGRSPSTKRWQTATTVAADLTE